METGALTIELQTCLQPSSRFLVNRVPVAKWAMFLVFHAPRLFAPVLGGGIVTAFAIAAGKYDDFARHYFYLPVLLLNPNLDPIDKWAANIAKSA